MNLNPPLSGNPSAVWTTALIAQVFDQPLRCSLARGESSSLLLHPCRFVCLQRGEHQCYCLRGDGSRANVSAGQGRL